MPGRSARHGGHGGRGSKLWTDPRCSSRAAGSLSSFSSAKLAKQPEGFQVWIVANPFLKRSHPNRFFVQRGNSYGPGLAVAKTAKGAIWAVLAELDKIAS